MIMMDITVVNGLYKPLQNWGGLALYPLARNMAGKSLRCSSPGKIIKVNGMTIAMLVY